MNDKLKELITNCLEHSSNSILEDEANSCTKPNYTNRHFLNTLIVFKSALIDKIFDVQEYDDMGFEDRVKMVEKAGEELHKLIFTYTNLDTHKIEEFL